MKKVSAIAAALSIFAFAGAAFAGGAFSPGDLKASADSKVGVKAANTVYFGNYWITSANTGSPKEAIAWKLVSAKSKDKDGKTAVKILSDQGLYVGKFNNMNYTGRADDASMWEKAPIRTTLNERTKGEGFAGDAFSTKEYDMIAMADTYTMPDSQATPYQVTVPVQTYDKLYLLSYEEAKDGGSVGVTGKDDRAITLTTFAQKCPVYGLSSTYDRGESYDGSIRYWLRSPADGWTTDYVKGVANNFTDIDITRFKRDTIMAIRPACELSAANVAFLSAAEGGKSEVALGAGFALADYSGTEFKVTFIDASVNAPTVNLKIEDGKLNGTFSGAVTGTNQYLSAYLKNSSGKVLNYAKLADCDTAADGSFTLDFAGVADGEYKLSFVSEQENGAKQSDFASKAAAYVAKVAGGKITEIKEDTKPEPEPQPEPQPEPEPTPKPSGDSGSGGGGCNAGFGMLALLFAAPMFFKKEK
ncbi:MAG: SYNERG-CTERM sorting domain-containing protein [Synergistaceae bacterium]|nr:SYNERG-CTERM sorting domain-containing protein [Candidatus Equadaptatus faecalis]